MDLFHKLEKMKVLLIDDDEAIRSSLRFYFGAMGWQIRVVQSAEEGLEALKGERYDVIFCDYQLPGMNGLEFFKITKETSPYSLRVLITAYASDEVAAEAARIGVHELIEKPLSIEIIEASIERLSEKHEKELKEEPHTDSHRLAEAWDAAWSYHVQQLAARVRRRLNRCLMGLQGKKEKCLPKSNARVRVGDRDRAMLVCAG